MRKFLGIGLLTGLLVAVTSCASFDKDKVKAVKNAAVYTIAVNSAIDMSDFSGFASAVSTIVQSGKFDLSDILRNLNADMFDTYAKALPFQLAPEQEILTNPTFMSYVASRPKTSVAFESYMAPNGYPVGVLNDFTAKEITKALPFKDAWVGLWMGFKLKKTIEILGIANAKVEATLYFTVYNKNGETVLYKLSSAMSETDMAVVLGAFSADPLQKMCAQAAVNVRKDFEKWIKTELAK